MVILTSTNFSAEVLAAVGLVLVDFWAPWCGPCRMMEEVLGEVGDLGEEIKIAKVNVDEEAELAREYGIMSIPTLIFFQEGKEVKRLVGVRGKEELIGLIRQI